MHHFFEAITNTSGDSLVGYFARVVDTVTGSGIALYSDNASTPIRVVSGVENAATTDEFGNLSFYVVAGTYHLDIYQPDATTFVKRVQNVAMNSGRGDPGPAGPEGPQGEQGPKGDTDTYPRSAINSFLPLLAWTTAYYQGASTGAGVNAGPTLFYDFGSSVGNGAGQGAFAATDNPGAYFFQKARAFFDPLNIYQFTRTNGSVDGSTILAMEQKWRTVIAPLAPKVSFGVPGMNDFQESQWNANETFNPFSGSPALLRALLRTAQQTGTVVVLSTSPHPHIDRLTYNFFALNPSFSQLYPVEVAAPVPQSAVVPTAANARVSIPWKGATIRVDARFLRGNEMIRKAAAEFGVPVVDAERKQFDLLAAGYTYDEMFDAGETVHPNQWAIQQTYHAATDDLFAGMRADYALTAQPSAIGPRLGVNADETAPYAVRVMPSGADDLLLLEKPDGSDALTVDKNGNVNQVAGDTFRIGDKLIRRLNLDPGLGEPYDDWAGAPNTDQPVTFAMPPNAGARMFIKCQQPGSGHRAAHYTVSSNASSVAISAEVGGAGTTDPFYTVTVSGMNIVITPLSENTSIKARFDIW